MKFKRDYNMQNFMYIVYAPWSSDRGKLRKRGEHDDLHVLLNHDLHSNIINYYRSSRLAFAHV